MSTQVYDFLEQLSPLRLLRAQQVKAHSDEPALFDDFARPLHISSAPERERTADRLLYARRRAAHAS